MYSIIFIYIICTQYAIFILQLKIYFILQLKNILFENLCVFFFFFSFKRTKRVTFFEKQRLNIEENNQKLNEQLSDVERKRYTILIRYPLYNNKGLNIYLLYGRLTSEKDALTEKEWRTTLQKLIDEQQEHITSLQSELENLKSTASEALRMKKDYSLLQKKCSEYELSLEEIGKQLQESVPHLLLYKLYKGINYYFKFCV